MSMRYDRWRIGAALCALLAMLALPLAFAAPAFAATPITVTGDEEDGYGRLIFAWPRHDDPLRMQSAPKFEALTSANVLVVSFETPFEADLSELAAQMPRYVALIRTDPGNRTLRLALKADFRINTHEAGHEIYVDLLPPNWKGAPPGLPDDVLARLEEERSAVVQAVAEKEGEAELNIAEPKPGVTLRVGEHETFTRLVFDWGQPVLYNISARDGRVTVIFDRDAELPLARLRVDPPAFLVGASAASNNGRLSVAIDTVPGVTVRDFREDLNVVIDIVAPGRGAPPLVKAPAPPPKSKSEETDTAARPEAAPSAPAKSAKQDAGTKTSDTQKPDTQKADAPQPAAKPQQIASGTAVPAEPEAGKREAEPAGEKMAATDGPPEAGPGSEKAGPAAVQPAAVQPGALVPADHDGPLNVAAELVGESVRLIFPWPERTGAAAFQRDGRIWLVFDAKRELDFSALTAGMSKVLGPAELVAMEDATIVQFQPPQRVLLAASEKGNNWVFTMGDTIVEPVRPVSLFRGWSANGEAKVSLDLNGRGKVHWVRDPNVKDVLAIVTAEGPPQGMVAPRNFVEFAALATAQGLAFVSLSDDLYVRAIKDEVIVSRGAGLTLSSGDVEEYADPETAAVTVEEPVQPGKMDFQRWREAPGANYAERRQFYLDKLANAPADNLDDQLDYARFLLAYQLGAEAIAVLRLAEKLSSDVALEPAYLALRGVGHIMMHRFDEALSDLSGKGLAQDPHAALWRGTAQAELGNMREARDEFDRAGRAFTEYEPDFQAMFRVKAAEAELAAGDLASVAYNLNEIPEETENNIWLAEAQLVRGLMLEAAGKADEALETLERLEKRAPRPVAARARFAKAKMKHKMGLLADAAFMQELQAIGFMWRGDDLELSVMARLGEMHVAMGEVEDGLRVMQTAVTNFPETDQARRIATTMTDTFSDLFLGGGADEMDPVEALSLYYDFRELTPIGQRGDAMIRQLSDKLVDVDLLDQAAELLQHQVDHRLRGIARAQVATRLALVRLMDHKPEKALEALRSTRQSLLPDNLADKRRLLEARALSELNLYDHALDLLSEMDTEEAEWMKADVLWSAQRWEETGRQVESALGNAWLNEREFPPKVRRMIMRAAIAYSLADDPAGLGRLREKFGEQMRAGSDAGKFAILSEPIERQGEEFRRLAKEFAGADTLDEFVSTLGKELEAQSATAIN